MYFTGGTAEARGNIRLYYTVDLHECLPRLIVRVVGRFFETQNGRKTDIAAFHDVAPFIPRFGFEHALEFFIDLRPTGRLPLGRQAGIGEICFFQQFGVELRLDGGNRNELCVRRLVDLVEVSRRYREH